MIAGRNEIAKQGTKKGYMLGKRFTRVREEMPEDEERSEKRRRTRACCRQASKEAERMTMEGRKTLFRRSNS